MTTTPGPRPPERRSRVKFKADPALGEKPKAVPTDYEKSGYAIGHQAPSADFTSREQFMRDTFFLSNAVPQEGIGFNTGVWSGLERLVRTLAEQRSPLFDDFVRAGEQSRRRGLVSAAPECFLPGPAEPHGGDDQ